MTQQLQQSGIFKVRPTKWEVYEAQSGAVAVSMTFRVVEELAEDRSWASWAEYEEHIVYGSWWVVKKDGKINVGALEQLVECLGWDGNLTSIVDPAPDKVVQVTVKEEEYDGTVRYKASWMNPEDFEGGSFGVDEAGVKQLQAKFGSLMRAAAASIGKPATKAKGPKPKAKVKAKGAGADNPAVTGKPVPDDDIPFDGGEETPFD